ncbi:MAG: hypothetical protein U0169_09180 [Polyangiaceae bacterium]
MAVRVKTLSCPECSAPLPVPKRDEAAVRCTYCGNTLQVERQRKPANAPPKPHTVYVPRGPSSWIFVVAFAPVLLPFVIALAPKAYGVWKARVRPFPSVCAVNETLELEGVTWTGTGTAIEAKTNCTLVLRNVTVTSDVLVKGETNVTITLDHVTAKAKTALLELGANAKVEIVDSDLSSARRGIAAESSAQVELRRSKVKSAGPAVRATSNLKVDADAATLEGDDAAIVCTSNGNVTLDGQSSVVSAGTALEADSNLALDVGAATIRGGPVAVHATSNAKVKLKNGATVRATTYAIETTANLDLSGQGGTIASDAVAVSAESATCACASTARQSAARRAFMFQRAPTSFAVSEDRHRCTSVRRAPRGPPVRRDAVVRFEPDEPGSSRAAGPSDVADAERGASKPTTPGAGARRKELLRSRRRDRALDEATTRAGTSCRSTSAKTKNVVVTQGFVPDGRNANAQVASAELRSTPEGQCIQAIFRAVRVPPYDPNSQSGGLYRVVTLK